MPGISLATPEREEGRPQVHPCLSHPLNTMASPNGSNWKLVLGSVLCLYFVAQACNSTPQGMSDYQRAQLQLQQQQLANDAANRAAAQNAAILNTGAQIFGQTYDYSGGNDQTRCVTGLDGLGRVVTECAQH